MTVHDFLKAQEIQEKLTAYEALLEGMRKADEEQGFELVAFLTYGSSNQKIDFDEILETEEILKLRKKLIDSVEAKIKQLREEFADI